MKRETWGSKLGFIFAAAGSAVGLANIWRFPYVVGSSGGAVFVAVYLICLALIGVKIIVVSPYIFIFIKFAARVVIDYFFFLK